MKSLYVFVFLSALNAEAMKLQLVGRNCKNLSQKSIGLALTNKDFVKKDFGTLSKNCETKHTHLSNQKTEHKQSLLLAKPKPIIQKRENFTLTQNALDQLANVLQAQQLQDTLIKAAAATLQTRENETAENYEKHANQLEKTIEKLSTENEQFKKIIGRNHKLMLEVALVLIKKEIADGNKIDKELLAKYKKYFCFDELNK